MNKKDLANILSGFSKFKQFELSCLTSIKGGSHPIIVDPHKPVERPK